MKVKVCGSCGTRDPDDPYSREVTAAHMVNTMNSRVYELGSMNFRVLAHSPSPRPPPSKQLNVPQPGFSPAYKCQGRDWWTPFLQDCLRTFDSVECI